MDEKPRTYHAKPHPLARQDLHCEACGLGKNRERANSKKKDSDPIKTCVPGAGPDDLKNVKLILISDYPGHYEELHGYPQYDSTISREKFKNGLLQARNSGAFIRMALNRMYGLDTYNDMWITNAVRCNPNQLKVIENAHIKPCVGLWLGPELALLDEHAPNAPILVAGQHAFRAIKQLYKKEAAELNKLGLNGCRRRDDIRLGSRPAIFAPNPVRAARSEFRIETQLMFLDGKWRVSSNRWLYPQPVGGPVTSLIEDLKFLRKFLC